MGEKGRDFLPPFPLYMTSQESSCSKLRQFGVPQILKYKLSNLFRHIYVWTEAKILIYLFRALGCATLSLYNWWSVYPLQNAILLIFDSQVFTYTSKMSNDHWPILIFKNIQKNNVVHKNGDKYKALEINTNWDLNGFTFLHTFN